MATKYFLKRCWTFIRQVSRIIFMQIELHLRGCIDENQEIKDKRATPASRIRLASRLVAAPFRRDFALLAVRQRFGQTLVNLFYDASPRAEEPLFPPPLCGRRRRRPALINNFSRGPCRSGDDNPAEIRRSRAFGEASLYRRGAYLHASEALSRMYRLACAMHS